MKNPSPSTIHSYPSFYSPQTWCGLIAISLVMGVAEPCSSAQELTRPLSVKTGQAVTLALPDSVHRIAIADPTIADVNLINGKEVYLLGKRSGKTNLVIWSSSQKTQLLDVQVVLDLLPLQLAFQQNFPDEISLKVNQLGNTLVLTGTVTDTLKAHQIIQLSRAFLEPYATPIAAANVTAEGKSAGFPASMISHQLGSHPTTYTHSALGMHAPISLINLLKVSAPQQVRLDVKVAEVSKTWLQQWGAKLGLSTHSGAWSASLGSALSNAAAPAMVSLTSDQASLSVSAQSQDSLIKTLAEPSLLAISGQQASFLAGGKVFIPVVQSTAQGAPLSSLEEKEFGIALKFTPTVLNGGRIHLKVAPEVSELNPQGLGFAASGVSGQAILPVFTSRRASTAVELRDGESFAIGGLMQNNVNSSIQAVPWLSDLPVLGALFRSSQFQKDQTELLFVVTPHLVSPSDIPLALPTDHYSPPSSQEFFLEGKQQADQDSTSTRPGLIPILEPLPQGHPAEWSRAPVEPDAVETLRGYERFQNDEGSALPMIGLPRSSAVNGGL